MYRVYRHLQNNRPASAKSAPPRLISRLPAARSAAESLPSSPPVIPNLHLEPPRGHHRIFPSVHQRVPGFLSPRALRITQDIALVPTAKLGLTGKRNDGERCGNAWQSEGEESGECLYAMSAVEAKGESLDLFIVLSGWINGFDQKPPPALTRLITPIKVSSRSLILIEACCH